MAKNDKIKKKSKVKVKWETLFDKDLLFFITGFCRKEGNFFLKGITEIRTKWKFFSFYLKRKHNFYYMYICMYIYIILYIFMCACTQSYYFSNEKQEFYFFKYNGGFSVVLWTECVLSFRKKTVYLKKWIFNCRHFQLESLSI